MVKDEHISRYIGILSNKLRREIDALSFRGQYSGTQGKALHFILAHSDSDLFQRDIEEEFGLRPPSASALIKKLEENGLIIRQSIGYDKRYKKIIPSQKAMQNKQNVIDGVEALESRLLKDLSDEELEQWLKITKKMIDNL